MKYFVLVGVFVGSSMDGVSCGSRSFLVLFLFIGVGDVEVSENLDI